MTYLTKPRPSHASLKDDINTLVIIVRQKSTAPQKVVPLPHQCSARPPEAHDITTSSPFLVCAPVAVQQALVLWTLN